MPKRDDNEIQGMGYVLGLSAWLDTDFDGKKKGDGFYDTVMPPEKQVQPDDPLYREMSCWKSLIKR